MMAAWLSPSAGDESNTKRGKSCLRAIIRCFIQLLISAYIINAYVDTYLSYWLQNSRYRKLYLVSNVIPLTFSRYSYN